MKTKIVLTKEQVDQLVATQEKQLKAKFERDLIMLRKKYEVAEIEVDFMNTPFTKTEKLKLTDELFKQYIDEGLTINEIADKTGYNKAYLYKYQKRMKKVLSE